MKEHRRWPLVLASLPLWPIACLLLAATVARLRLGDWPRYNRPDPATISPLILDVAVFPLLLMAPVAALVSLLLAGWWWYSGRRDWKQNAIVTVASFLILISWVWIDPAGFFEWWAD